MNRRARNVPKTRRRLSMERRLLVGGPDLKMNCPQKEIVGGNRPSRNLSLITVQNRDYRELSRCSGLLVVTGFIDSNPAIPPIVYGMAIYHPQSLQSGFTVSVSIRMRRRSSLGRLTRTPLAPASNWPTSVTSKCLEEAERSFCQAALLFASSY